MPAAIEPTVRVQREDFDIATEIERLSAGRTDVGAIVTFTGLCRDEAGTLQALELEHYPGMAEAEIIRIARQAAERWPVSGLTAVHRYGRIEPGQNIVLVVAASRHRKAAFRGRVLPHGLPEDPCAFLEEGTPPRWEQRRLGRSEDADEAAAGRWAAAR